MDYPWYFFKKENIYRSGMFFDSPIGNQETFHFLWNMIEYSTTLGVSMERVRREIELSKDCPYQGRDCLIAVMDTGMSDHPDLMNRKFSFIDFVNGSVTPYDDHGHGTHICGIIAGTGKLSKGIYHGIAPKAELLVMKILDEHGNGESKCILEALEYLASLDRSRIPSVINISVGLEQKSDLYTYWKIERIMDRLVEEGCMVVCSAGNRGPKDGTIMSLSQNREVLSVGCYDLLYANDSKGACAGYSGRGIRNSIFRKPDLVAPGTNIISCGSDWRNRPYVSKSGTSMATAIVSGACALYIEKYKGASSNEIRRKMRLQAMDLALPANMQGYGFLNLKNLT